MSEKMSPLGFDELIGLAVDEYKRSKTVLASTDHILRKRTDPLPFSAMGWSPLSEPPPGRTPRWLRTLYRRISPERGSLSLKPCR